MEQDIKDRFNEIEGQLQETNTRVDRVEERMYTSETNIKIIETNMNLILADTKEIKGDIKDIKQKREEDHYVKPLQNIEKIKFQVMGVVIGIFISAFIGFILPNLKWGDKNDTRKIYRTI